MTRFRLPRHPRPGCSRRVCPQTGLWLVLCTATCLSGCARIFDFAAISKGNRLHERGFYQDAVAAYLGVEEGSFESTVDYDLANVYARIGEYSAAAALYERARRAGDIGLRADSFFNEGVASYEKGRYEEAWRSFKDVLDLYLSEPTAFSGDFAADARRNLELSWRSWKKRSLAPPDTVAPSGRLGGGRDDTELRLLRRLETGRWKPGSKMPQADVRGDY